ncbi:NADPH HC-toxin reductase 1 isoform X3 [Quercus suber]|uniref:NADPH HC-toxin reductase 1 isoform X3 n=1 Tax=Quercus suber TaxID=58331 RepID=UPI000CE194A8|nr:dihydroflavonol 4-reductase-like isoform X2 [Quercus suber]POF00405.1 dihydroflavonol 4-reductase [Quercus suber]
MEEKSYSRICITGGSGFIGSCLVKKLLGKGHTVHATLRNKGDTSKVDLLKSFPNAENKLVLFQADIYNPAEFEPAITGCEYVFHVATPLLHNTQSSQYKDTAEAAVAGVRIIADACIRSKTVKRLIYTASVMSSSPLTEDGVCFKSCIDETCWTPFDVSFTYANDFTMELLGSIPLVHIEDICQAHIFCMENQSMKGRFLCAATNPTIRAIASSFQEKFPEYQIAKEFIEGPDKGVTFDSTKLMKMGFEYAYDTKKILDDSVACGRRLGYLIK